MTETEPILPRELTDIPDEVRNVPPPPLPEVPEPYALRLADPDADAEMIAEWMNRPTWSRPGNTRGQPADGVAIFTLSLPAATRGRSSAA
ncbi:lysine N-acyltransferase mbtK [Mycobacterium xenopi 3993]|nr:lysine N-acyltransferase mbtK [Mycobacterium xenopi 3993]